MLCSHSVQYNSTQSLLEASQNTQKTQKLPALLSAILQIYLVQVFGEKKLTPERTACRKTNPNSFFTASSPTAQQMFLSSLSVGGQEQMALETYNRSSLMQCFLSIPQPYKVQGLPERGLVPTDIPDLSGFFVCVYFFFNLSSLPLNFYTLQCSASRSFPALPELMQSFADHLVRLVG